MKFAIIGKKTICGAALLLLMNSAVAQAIPIIGLFSTGTMGAEPGTPAAPGSTDLHYTVTTPALTTAAAIVETPNGAYVTSAIGNARYIGSTAVDALNGSSAAAGNYVFQTTFDLTGFDPSTAFITGRFASDNTGTVTLNGLNAQNNGANQFNSFTAFSFAAAQFLPGLNTLTFVVNNAIIGPIGLQAEILSSNVDAASVPGAPEINPASAALPFAMFLGLGLMLRDRRRLVFPA